MNRNTLSHYPAILSRLTLCAIMTLGMGCNAVNGDRQWFKGNTHTHSLWSDGNDFPEMIALWYRDQGYDFLVLSDHNILSQGDKWYNITQMEKRGGSEAIPKAIAKFGEDHLVFRGEGDKREVKLKNLPEIKAIAETESFILIQGEEISDGFGGKPIHTNGINLEELIPAPKGNSLRETMRNAILAVEAQSKKHDKPMLAHLNHPNFHYAVTAEDLAHVIEEKFFEVYNGHPGINNLGDEIHASDERLWDIANTIRIAELKAAPMYGVATDDSHTYHTNQTVTPGRGWIMVQANTLHPDKLVTAMQHGKFYASTGVTLTKIQYDGKKLKVAIDAEEGVEYTVDFIGTLEDYDTTVEPKFDEKGVAVTSKYSHDVGHVLQSSQGTQATYKLTGKELFVRAVVRSNKPHPNPSLKEQVTQAWTQPVGWEHRVNR